MLFKFKLFVDVSGKIYLNGNKKYDIFNFLLYVFQKFWQSYFKQGLTDSRCLMGYEILHTQQNMRGPTQFVFRPIALK